MVPLDQVAPAWDTRAVVRCPALPAAPVAATAGRGDPGRTSVVTKRRAPTWRPSGCVHRTIAGRAHRDGGDAAQHRDRQAHRASTTTSRRWRRLPRAVLEPLVLMTAPVAPHITEELWSKLGHGESSPTSRSPGRRRRPTSSRTPLTCVLQCRQGARPDRGGAVRSVTTALRATLAAGRRPRSSGPWTDVTCGTGDRAGARSSVTWCQPEARDRATLTGSGSRPRLRPVGRGPPGRSRHRLDGLAAAWSRRALGDRDRSRSRS